VKRPAFYIQQSVPNYQLIRDGFGVIEEYKSLREARKALRIALKSKWI